MSLLLPSKNILWYYVEYFTEFTVLISYQLIHLYSMTIPLQNRNIGVSVPFSPAHKASQWSENSGCLWSMFLCGWRPCMYSKAQAVFKTQNLIFLFLWVQVICTACLPSSNEVKLLQRLLSYQHQSHDNILEAGEVNKPHGPGSMLSLPYCRWVSLGCLKVFS